MSPPFDDLKRRHLERISRLKAQTEQGRELGQTLPEGLRSFGAFAEDDPDIHRTPQRKPSTSRIKSKKTAYSAREARPSSPKKRIEVDEFVEKLLPMWVRNKLGLDPRIDISVKTVTLKNGSTITVGVVVPRFDADRKLKDVVLGSLRHEIGQLKKLRAWEPQVQEVVLEIARTSGKCAESAVRLVKKHSVST